LLRYALAPRFMGTVNRGATANTDAVPGTRDGSASAGQSVRTEVIDGSIVVTVTY
jgi:hypothetical protein